MMRCINRSDLFSTRSKPMAINAWRICSNCVWSGVSAMCASPNDTLSGVRPSCDSVLVTAMMQRGQTMFLMCSIMSFGAQAVLQYRFGGGESQ
ncbi:MAG: hypothetical protein EGQ88_04795 [Prevotellamassilia timonensis]|nr:hypothetical protein [Prevotellamassilia timonensis]